MRNKTGRTERLRIARPRTLRAEPVMTPNRSGVADRSGGQGRSLLPASCSADSVRPGASALPAHRSGKRGHTTFQLRASHRLPADLCLKPVSLTTSAADGQHVHHGWDRCSEFSGRLRPPPGSGVARSGSPYPSTAPRWESRPLRSLPPGGGHLQAAAFSVPLRRPTGSSGLPGWF